MKNRTGLEGSDSTTGSIDGDNNSDPDATSNGKPLTPPILDNPLERTTMIKALKQAQVANIFRTYPNTTLRF